MLTLSLFVSVSYRIFHIFVLCIYVYNRTVNTIKVLFSSMLGDYETLTLWLCEQDRICSPDTCLSPRGGIYRVD